MFKNVSGINLVLLLFVSCLFASCRSVRQFVVTQPWTETDVPTRIRYKDTPASGYSGVSRIRNYDFTHPDVPSAFEGFRIGFISDLHYKSLFKEPDLADLVRLLNQQQVDVLLMGGDYQEGCEYVVPLFEALAQVRTSMGIYGVMGNNDYERCHDLITNEMMRHGMKPMEHTLDTLKRNGEQIILAGIRNPFNVKRNGVSPTLELNPKDFVIMLVHTPDYAEDVSITNTDLVLAGHTHGGQVCILGYAPIVPSYYGNRFRSGLKFTTAQVPLLVTNGLGTSNKNVRIGAPAEIVVITLHRGNCLTLEKVDLTKVNHYA